MTKSKTRSRKLQSGNDSNMPRQPPLPPGPPPPRGYNNSYDQYPRGDSYHPGDRYNPPLPMYQFRGGGGDSYQPYRSSHDREQRGRTPPRNSYGSGGDDRSYRPSYGDPRPPPGPMAINDPSRRRDEGFNFRYDAPAGMDYRAADQYRPRSPPRGRANDRNGYQNNDNNRDQRRFPNNRGRGGGRGGVRWASDRAFLKTNREPTPDLMPGMDEDTGNGHRYIPVEDLSESEEVDMDISNSEAENNDQQPKKKQARTETKAADGDSVPRWSNPDPYTALPPPDESQRKKKDVVKLIRKARVSGSMDHAKTEATTDDFISFDFADEETDHQIGIGVVGAPTGPRSKNDGPSQQAQSSGALADIGLPERPMNMNDISTSGSKAGSGDIGGDLRGAGNSELGTRKRNLDGEIKAPPRIHGGGMGKKKAPASGSIVRQWQPVDGQSPTPWISLDHSDSTNMSIWLHKEIMDFYHYVKPRDLEQFIRVKLVENLRSSVKNYFDKDADILSFGSFPAGLYLPTADMDLVCVSDRFMRGHDPVFYGRALYKFRAFLVNNKMALDDKIEVVPKAKVPLVKYVDSLTGLRVDISFENDTGLIANKTFQNWKATYPAMPIIVSLIKHLLAMRGLNEPVNGGIGGFSVICLVVSLLQLMPQVQSKTMIPEHHLGDILLEFFDLYGNQFDMETTAISLNPPGYISKVNANVAYNQRNPNKFCIIDPNRSSNDISGGAKNSQAIRNLFSDCHNILRERMLSLQYSADRHCASILGAIIGGNYSSFDLQREHLAHIHEINHGHVTHTAA